jgi:hypothetical protein
MCCLMVEALESFRNGWKDTAGKSESAFCGFFQAHDEFKELQPVAHEFYREVRVEFCTKLKPLTAGG